MTCPDCGASNPSGAEWCGLCARPFGSTLVAEPEVPTAPTAGAPAESHQPGRWTCPACDTANPVDLDACATCGTSIFDAFGRGEESATARRDAARLAWVPAAGHVALGDTPTGAMVGAVLGVGLLLGLLLVFAPGVAWAGYGCILLGLGTWAVAGVDVARRTAGGPALITARRLLWVGAAQVGLVVIAVLGAGGA